MENNLPATKILHAAYVCLKSSIAEDLKSIDELKTVLQYAGYNPSVKELKTIWIEKDISKLSFNDFITVAESYSSFNEETIMKLFQQVLNVNDGRCKLKEFEEICLPAKCLPNQQISIFSGETVLDEYIDVLSLSKSIVQTVNELKCASLASVGRSSDHHPNIKCPNAISKAALSTNETKHNINYKAWDSSYLRGCFYLDKEVIISHQYFFYVKSSGLYTIELVPERYKTSMVVADLLAFLFKETEEGYRNYIQYTDIRSDEGSCLATVNLKEGKYVIIPFTSGCILRNRAREVEGSITLLHLNNNYQLTKEFLTILEDIFKQIDLDGNSSLSRQEFNLYNWRTSGEVVQDDEWNIVQGNFDVLDGELTMKGFVSLHQLEAEDNEGDTEDLWLSLEAMGYNQQGKQDQASSFKLALYSKSEKPDLFVSGLRSGGLLLDRAFIRSVMEETEPENIQGNCDLYHFQAIYSQRASVVIQNKSSNKYIVQVNCSESVNCITNRPNLNWNVEIDGKSAIIAHQLTPKDITLTWKVVSNVTIVAK